MNSLWDIRIFLGLVPKESSCITKDFFIEVVIKTNFMKVNTHVRLVLSLRISRVMPYSAPRGLRCGFAGARLLRSRVRISAGTWMSLSSECCILSGRGLFDELITRPEESYWMWFVYDREASTTRRPWPSRSCRAMGEKYQTAHLYLHVPQRPYMYRSKN
jgi:hypothetical protein